MNFNLLNFQLAQASAAITTGGVDVYTCPANKAAVVLGSRIINVDGTNSATVTVRVEEGANTPEHTYSYTIDGGGFLRHPVERLTVLEAGKDIKATASTNGDLKMVVSFLLVDV